MLNKGVLSSHDLVYRLSRALLDLTPELQLAVKTQLTPLGGHLVAVGLITLDEYGWLINPTLR